MGIKFDTYQQAAKRSEEKQYIQQKKDKNCSPQQILEQFHDIISVLPARQDLKKMLKKSIYGIFTHQKIDSEINFLSEVRTFLNKVREEDLYYVELLELLERIYHLGVDAQLEKQFNPDKCKEIQVRQETLNLFHPQAEEQPQQHQQQQQQSSSQEGIYIFQDEGEEYVIDEDYDNVNEDEVQEQQQQEDEIDNEEQNEGREVEEQKDNLEDLHLQEEQVFSQYYQDQYESMFQQRIDRISQNIVRNYSNSEDKYSVIQEAEDNEEEDQVLE